MSAPSSPLVRFSSSTAKRRQSWSRKSPVSIVPPGNWCEILSFLVSALAVPAIQGAASGTAAEAARSRRREMVMSVSSS